VIGRLHGALLPSNLTPEKIMREAAGAPFPANQPQVLSACGAVPIGNCNQPLKQVLLQCEALVDVTLFFQTSNVLPI
jgi:hypothetical protein